MLWSPRCCASAPRLFRLDDGAAGVDNGHLVDSLMRPNSPFQALDVSRFLSETPHKILAQVQTPEFLVQLAVVVVGVALAWWLSRLVQRPLARFAQVRPGKNWAAGFIRAAKYVALPLFWLAVLWAGALVGLALGLQLPLLDAAIDLVFAWICIRLLSFTVKSQAMSVTISLAAWSVAALSILDLYRPLVTWLRRVPVYDAKQNHITLYEAVSALVVLIVLLWLTRLLYRFLQRRIVQATTLTPSLQVLLNQLLQIFLPTIAVIVALQTVGVNLTTLTVAFGAIGIGVGLGLQKMVSNLVAGLSLIMGKSIKPGDIIEYKNSYGWVTAMGARFVTLRTRDGVEHLIPNDYFLDNGVENWSYSDAALRLHVPVGISYDCDPHQAMAICFEAAKSVRRVISHPEPLIILKGFGDSAIDLEIRFWIEDPRNGTGNVKSDVLLAVWDRFKAAGITIPYPQREVHVVSMPDIAK